METVSALLAICAGNSPVPAEFPAQMPVALGFDVFSDLRPNKRLSKQSWGWWLETPSHSLWRHRNRVAAEGMLKIHSNKETYQSFMSEGLQKRNLHNFNACFSSNDGFKLSRLYLELSVYI